MRFLYPLVILFCVAAGLTDFGEGRIWTGLGFLAIAAAAGALLWRDLRNPGTLRKGGEMARIIFTFERGAGVEGHGTFARVKTPRAEWHVVLDRRREREDLERDGVAYPGWVWLDGANLPKRVRIDAGMTWSSFDVKSAARAGT